MYPSQSDVQEVKLEEKIPIQQMGLQDRNISKVENESNPAVTVSAGSPSAEIPQMQNRTSKPQNTRAGC